MKNITNRLQNHILYDNIIANIMENIIFNIDLLLFDDKRKIGNKRTGCLIQIVSPPAIAGEGGILC